MMTWFNDLNLKIKLLVFFLMVGLIPFISATSIAYISSDVALETQITDQLAGIREIKKRQLEVYFTERRGDMNIAAETAQSFWLQSSSALRGIQAQKRIQLENYFQKSFKVLADTKVNLRFISAVKEFSEVFAKGLQSPEYKTLLTTREKGLKGFRDNMGYNDVYLIDAEGNVIYSVNKESDLGQNVKQGNLRDTGLGRVFAKARYETAVEDFSFYEPNKGFAAFMSTPLFDESGAYLGSVVFELPINEINSIVQERTGLPSTAESFLVGKSEDGKIGYRSDRVIKEGKLGEEKSSAVREAVTSGKSGRNIVLGSTGKWEMSIYEPLNVPGLSWGIITSVTVEEIVSPKAEGETEDYFTNYKKSYGYRDVLFVANDGSVFYSVGHQADYETNAFTGQFKNTGMARAAKKALDSRGFAFEDFDRYA
ncbi:MAG: hypothetical protein RL637_1307, partial [Pseudomonadota bacterium]